eukprot:TRINITY_DN2819_c0_g2_i1.p1 TRINITY_DN2819_c0_g2~~TRINITY_DN2819_c0_g2_i1.p1  ORF type:complete len:534 (+),score=97.79 TRINITY_DN2819_c0_g2_i1:55-1656(+)
MARNGACGGVEDGQIYYPEPRIKWYPNAEHSPSLRIELGNRGLGGAIPKPKAIPVPTAAPADKQATEDAGSRVTVKDEAQQDEELVVLLKGASSLEQPAAGIRCYRATAFYQSDGHQPREVRKTDAKEAKASASRQGFHDCDLQKVWRLPYNSREQFVKVAIYGDADGADILVGEATIPIADPSCEQLNDWRLMRDFEERGEVYLQVFFPGADLGSLVGLEIDEKPHLDVEEKLDLAAKYASVRQKSVVDMTSSVSKAESAIYSKISAASTEQAALHSRLNELTVDYSEGDQVQVFSKTSGAWVLAKVASVDRVRGRLIVQYGETRKCIDLLAPDLGNHLKRTNAADTPKGDGGVVLGDRVEIFSKSAGAWVPGQVARLDTHRKEVLVEYGGRARSISLEDNDIHNYFRKLENVQEEQPFGLGKPSNGLLHAPQQDAFGTPHVLPGFQAHPAAVQQAAAYPAMAPPAIPYGQFQAQPHHLQAWTQPQNQATPQLAAVAGQARPLTPEMQLGAYTVHPAHLNTAAAPQNIRRCG